MLYIVTGASTGIGRAVATSLAKRDHDVLAVARSADKLATLQTDCGRRLQAMPADLATETGRISVVNKVSALASAGGVDGIVHAAGSHVNPVEYQGINSDNMMADFQVHVATPIALNNLLAPVLKGARILYIDSYSASSLRVGWSGYSIVKAAAQMAARAAAEECTDSTVIRVFPGAVRTPLIDTILASQKQTPTVTLFKELESNGELTNPATVGEFIANIMISATDQQLGAREFWDIGRAEDRIFPQT